MDKTSFPSPAFFGFSPSESLTEETVAKICSNKLPFLNISSITAWTLPSSRVNGLSTVKNAYYVIVFEGSPQLWQIAHTDPQHSYLEEIISKKKTSALLWFFAPGLCFNGRSSRDKFFACEIGTAAIFQNPVPKVDFLGSGKAAAQEQLKKLKEAQQSQHRNLENIYVHNLKILLENLNSLAKKHQEVRFTIDEFIPFKQPLNLSESEIKYFINSQLIPPHFPQLSAVPDSARPKELSQVQITNLHGGLKKLEPLNPFYITIKYENHTRVVKQETYQKSAPRELSIADFHQMRNTKQTVAELQTSQVCANFGTSLAYLSLPQLTISSLIAWRAHSCSEARLYYLISFEGSPKLWALDSWSEHGHHLEEQTKLFPFLEEKKLPFSLSFSLPICAAPQPSQETNPTSFACRITNPSLFKESIPIISCKDKAPARKRVEQELQFLQDAKKAKNWELANIHSDNLRLLLEAFNTMVRSDPAHPIYEAPEFTQEEFAPFVEALSFDQRGLMAFENNLSPSGATYTTSHPTTTITITTTTTTTTTSSSLPTSPPKNPPPPKSSLSPLTLTCMAVAITLGIGLALSPKMRRWATSWFNH